ncbi:uncharacterized protein LOC134310328 isoform X1 [Trichomycterus rosablanca]|uniref:uncharacterized protein LOC134310328 isoform X1 n=1 Tax=Trichomycterus rosablanca TaxID=2290929 RepID=UPI002F3592C3
MDLISGILRRIQESSSSDSSLQGSSTSLKSTTTPRLNNQMVQFNKQELPGQKPSKSASLSSCKVILVKSADMSARSKISLDERPMTCPLTKKDSTDLKETMRQIFRKFDSKKYQKESDDNLTDLLSDALYKHIQSKCQSEISGLNEYTSSQDECNLSPSDSVTSSDLELASSALTELVLNDLKGTFDKKVENFKSSQSDIELETKATFEKFLIQPHRSETDLIITEVTDEDFSSEGSISDIDDSNHCPEVASQIIGSFGYKQILKKAVDKTARKVLMKKFSMPESFSVKEFSPDTEWLRSLTSEVIWLRSLIVGGVLENLSQNARKDAKESSEHIQSMPDARDQPNTAGNYTDARGIEEQSVSNVPHNQNGIKLKKRRPIRAFFRRAWQAVRQAFTPSKKRSNKVFPA